MPGRLAERAPLRRHALFSGILCHMPCEKLAGFQPPGLLLPRSPAPRPSARSLGCSRGKARRMPAPQGRFASSRSCRQASRRCQGSLAVSVEADLAAFPARVPQEEAAKPIPQADAWRLHRAGRQQAWRAGAACMFRRSASFLRHMSVRLAEALRSMAARGPGRAAPGRGRWFRPCRQSRSGWQDQASAFSGAAFSRRSKLVPGCRPGRSLRLAAFRPSGKASPRLDRAGLPARHWTWG